MRSLSLPPQLALLQRPVMLLTLVSVLLITTRAFAGTFTVTALTDSGAPGELRAAITQANATPGSTITFASGLSGTITLNSSLPTITAPMTIEGPGFTKMTIDGFQLCQPFTIQSSTGLVSISGLTVQNGTTVVGGGGINVVKSNVRLESCVITKCIASESSGGGIQNTGTLTMSGCLVSNCLTEDLTSEQSNGGGGIYNAGTLTLYNSSVSNCTAQPSSLLEAGGLGGGIANSGTASLVADNITGNTAQAGGGIASAGNLTVFACQVSGNVANSENTGLAQSLSGGGIDTFGPGTKMTVTDSTITGNNAAVGSGGGLGVSQSRVTLTNVIVENNSAAQGAGIAIVGVSAPCALTNVVVANNNSPGQGGGIYLNDTSDLIALTNCTIVGNEALGGTGLWEEGNTTTTLTNSIIYNNSPVILGQNVAQVNGPIAATFCDIAGGFAGTGNINFSPDFIDPDPIGVGAMPNLHLYPQSRCRAAGTPNGAPVIAADGFIRPNPPSIGAYEAQAELSLTSSLNPSTFGQSVTFSATVGTWHLPNSGTVTFSVDGKSASILTLGSGPTATAVYTTSGLSAGTHTVTATYSGTNLLTGNSVSVTQNVSPVPTVTHLSPDAGSVSGGTLVTISGSDLTADTTVAFGTTEATNIAVTSATTLTCTAPAGTGTVDVTVTTAGVTSAVGAADKYTYDAAPTVIGISQTAGPVAGGTNVTITGNAFLRGATVSFGSVAATNVVVASVTSITCKAPPGATGTVDATVTTTGGKSPVVAADRYTYEGVPTISRVTPNSGPAVGGTAVTIAGTGFITGATTVTFGKVAATDILVTNPTSLTCVSPAGTGTVDISVATKGGVSAITPSDKFTYVSLTIGSLTFSPASIAPGHSTVATVTLTEKAPVGGAQVLLEIGSGPFGYLITIPAGSNEGTVLINTTASAVAGTYPFTAIYAGKSVTASLMIQ